MMTHLNKTAKIIDGKAFAASIRQQVSDHVEMLKSEHQIIPGLAVVLVGGDPASQVYVRNKAKQTREVGMRSFEHKLDESVSESTLLDLIVKLNQDPEVHGILVQLPLPDHIDSAKVIDMIAVEKDVDGFHVVNVGRLASGLDALTPCTPLGCLLMLKDLHGDLSGKEAVIVGRSNIVGKPMAQLLLRNHCSVTVVHSRSQNIKEICQRADILVAAVGRAEMVKADWVKAGATVIDVGINRIENNNVKPRLVGDVDFASVQPIAGAITPVPGGVGPMTIACLLANTVTACCRIHDLTAPDGLGA